MSPRPMLRVALAQPAVERRRGDLNESACLDDLGEPLGAPLDLCVALRVSDHRCDAATTEVEHLRPQPEWPAEVGELEQHVRGVACQAETPKLVGSELVQPIERNLAAATDLERNPLPAHCLLHLGKTSLHELDRGRVVVPHMRSRGEETDTTRDGRPRHRNGVLDGGSPVIDAGKDVSMEIDHEASA